MKIEIEKKGYQAIDPLTKKQRILQVERMGVYRYYVYQQYGDIKGLGVDQHCQIEEERDA